MKDLCQELIEKRRDAILASIERLESETDPAGVIWVHVRKTRRAAAIAQLTEQLKLLESILSEAEEVRSMAGCSHPNIMSDGYGQTMCPDCDETRYDDQKNR